MRRRRLASVALVGALACGVLASAGAPVVAAVDTSPPVWSTTPTTAIPLGAVLNLDNYGSPIPDPGCSSSTLETKISWQAADPQSGIAGYALGGEGQIGSYIGMTTSTPQLAFVEDDACGGGGRDLDIFAINGAGLETYYRWAATRLSVAQDDGTVESVRGDAPGLELVYRGSWSTSACNCWSGGTTHKTTSSSASVTLTLQGASTEPVGLGLVMAKGPNRGKVAIFVDGVKVKTVDLKAATKINRTVVWRQTVDMNSYHEVKVVNLATAGRPRADLDAFVVISKD